MKQAHKKKVATPEPKDPVQEVIIEEQSVQEVPDEEIRPSIEVVEEDEVPAPTEELDVVLADQRITPSIEDEVVFIMRNALIKEIVQSWEGTPCMRPILTKPQEPASSTDRIASLDLVQPAPAEQLPLVEEDDVTVLGAQITARLQKDRERRAIERNPPAESRAVSETSQASASSRKKGRRSKDGLEKEAVSISSKDSVLAGKQSRMSARSTSGLGEKKKTKEKKGKFSLSIENAADELKHAEELVKGDGDKEKSAGGVDAVTPTELSVPAPVDWRLHLPDEDVEVVFERNNHYEGRISKKLMEGRGMYTWEDGMQYEGYFIGGEMTGKGRLRWPDMTWYEGDVVRGWRHGKGLYVSSEAKICYYGQWRWARKYGAGVCYYSDVGDDWYDGNWKDDMYEGDGIRQYQSGARYQGQWHDGRRHGVGNLVWPNKDLYRGTWKDGVPDGYGEYTWSAFINREVMLSNENVYRGGFRNGFQHGRGIMEYGNGARIVGTWSMGVKNGPGVAICANGAFVSGQPLFAEDRPAPLTVTLPEENAQSPTPPRKKNKPTSPVKPPSVTTPKKHTPGSKINRLKKSTDKVLKAVESVMVITDTEMKIKPRAVPTGAPDQDIDLSYHIARLRRQIFPKVTAATQTDDCRLKYKTSSQILAASEVVDEKRTAPKVQNVPDYETEKSTQTLEVTLTRDSVTSDGDNRDLTLIFASRKVLLESMTKVTHQLSKRSVRIKSPSNKPIKAVKIRSSRSATSKQGGSLKAEVPTVLSSDTPARLSPHGGLTHEQYERKWAERAILRHLPELREVYEEYAAVGSRQPRLTYRPTMARIVLWQMYRDCGLHTRGVTLVQLDDMLAANPGGGVQDAHYPYEAMHFWQFLHSLLDVAWLLYITKGVVKQGSRGVIGGAFDKLVEEDILPHTLGRNAASVLLIHRDLLPLDALYLLYTHLSNPLPARVLLYKICAHPTRTPRPRTRKIYPDHVVLGQNAIAVGGELTFLPAATPLACRTDAVKERDVDDPHATYLSALRNVGPRRVVKFLVRVCPGIMEEGLIVYMNYPMTFLEFYEVLLLCTDCSLRLDKRLAAKMAALEAKRLLELEAELAAAAAELDVVSDSLTSSLGAKRKKTSSISSIRSFKSNSNRSSKSSINKKRQFK